MALAGDRAQQLREYLQPSSCIRSKTASLIRSLRVMRSWTKRPSWAIDRDAEKSNLSAIKPPRLFRLPLLFRGWRADAGLFTPPRACEWL